MDAKTSFANEKTSRNICMDVGFLWIAAKWWTPITWGKFKSRSYCISIVNCNYRVSFHTFLSLFKQSFNTWNHTRAAYWFNMRKFPIYFLWQGILQWSKILSTVVIWLRTSFNVSSFTFSFDTSFMSLLHVKFISFLMLSLNLVTKFLWFNLLFNHSVVLW